MMLNDHHSDGGERRRRVSADRNASDREVPFGPRAEIADAVHAWLDGVTPEQELSAAEWSRDVDFWKRIDRDLDARRRARTPAGLNARIMSSIPAIPVMTLPWWRREFVLTPTVALLALLGAMAASSWVTAAVLR